MEDTSLFKLENCGVSVGTKVILAPQTFSVNNGDFITISGRSGSGKSTLLQLFLGFLQPTIGRAFFKGQSMTGVEVSQLREYVAVVFQEPVLMGEYVSDAIYEPFNYKLNHNIKPERLVIERWFDKFELNVGLETKIDGISGGEKQRIALIRALLMQRSILILDEVTSALDEVHRALVFDIIIKSGMTIISVSHDSMWINNSPKNIVLEVPGSNGEE